VCPRRNCSREQESHADSLGESLDFSHSGGIINCVQLVKIFLTLCTL